VSDICYKQYLIEVWGEIMSLKKLHYKFSVFFLALICSSLLQAAEFPQKQINLVVPYGPGSAIDLVARSLAIGAEKSLGQTIVIENKVGAGGAIGTQYVMNRPADGYTIELVSVNPFVISSLTKSLAGNPQTDFSYIIRTTGYLMALAVRSDSPWKNINDFVQYAKANPGKVTYSSSGLVSTGNLNMEEFASLAGIKVTHIPMKSGSESNTALLGGHVDSLADAAWAPFEKDGKFRALMLFANERSPRYPQVPVPKDVVSANVQPGYLLIIGPKDMPKPVVKRLHDAFKAAMNDPAYIGVLEKFNLENLYLNSDDTKKAVMESIEPLSKMVINLKIGSQ
jgi:tripartite-type tricarboxylate transporter receptor subunit TctC